MSKAPRIKHVRFTKSYRNPQKDTDDVQFAGESEHVRTVLSNDGRWVGLFTKDRSGKETAIMVPADSKVEFVAVENPEELRAWLTGAEQEPVKRGPGRPPKPREPEAA